MNILGFSGLHHSVAFKKKHFPHLEERAYRIAQGFDSAAAIIVDNQIIASAAEERFTREKATGRFPLHAIQYCLNEANLKLEDIDYFAHGFSYEPHRAEFQRDDLSKAQFSEVYSREAQLNCIKDFLNIDIDKQKFISVPHHRAHAASTYYVSGFDKSLILIADGMGEVESMTIAVGSGNQIEVITKIPEIHSLGILYSVFTHYLGFESNMDEYKVMGLAPYGDPHRYFNLVMEMIHLKNDGTFTIPVLYKNATLEEKETYEGTLIHLENLFGLPRRRSSPITSEHQDIAAALQNVLQATLMHVLRYFKKETQQQNLCLAGGVTLNCTANGYIKKSKLFKKIFIQPAAGDDGTALGAALAVDYSHQPQQKIKKLGMPFLGPSFSEQEIAQALKGSLYNVKEYENFNLLAQDVVKHIASGKVIGCFQGRMEMGPRALGNRSILADPRDPNMRDKINSLIKKREDFRPFAPAVLAEEAHKYFVIEPSEAEDYNYMLVITDVREEYKKELPAVTHVNGSARVQTVLKDQCLNFWTLIHEFGKLTGISVLLNTSLNVRGQPIVCTPQDAIETFEMAQLDGLIMGNDFLTR